jgi:UTP--glucose-1-phosphate uridylyltransferase
MKIKKAVITAGGWGTRFLPITKAQPKEMLPIVNKPIIQYSIEEAIACGVEMVIIVTSSGKESIENHFDYSRELEQVLEMRGDAKTAADIRRLGNMVDITYLRQKGQLGLGHALLSASKVVGNEPFILMLPDDLFEQDYLVLKNMIDVYQEYRGSVLAVKQVRDEEVSRYGIIKPLELSRQVYQVTDLIEKPRIAEAPSNYAIMGRYILMPEIFSALADTPAGRNGEYQLTDGLKLMLKDSSIYAYEFEGERYDAGTILGLLQTNIAFAMKNPELRPEMICYLNEIINKEHTFQR